MRVKTTQLPGLRGEEPGEKKELDLASEVGNCKTAFRLLLEICTTANLSNVRLWTVMNPPSMHQHVYQAVIYLFQPAVLHSVCDFTPARRVYLCQGLPVRMAHGRHSASSIPTRPPVKTTTLPLFFKEKKGNSMN